MKNSRIFSVLDLGLKKYIKEVNEWFEKTLRIKIAAEKAIFRIVGMDVKLEGNRRKLSSFNSKLGSDNT